MTDFLHRPVLGSPGHARLPLFALHVTLVVVFALLTISDWDGPPRSAPVVVPVAVALGALQLRHSLAAARGQRPPGAAITFTMLTALVVVPTLWFKIAWWSGTCLVAASAAMLFRGRLARVLVVVAMVGPSVGVGVYDWFTYDPWSGVHTAMSWLVVTAAMAGALYALASLVRTLDELHVLRRQLADQAVAHERFRVSRDLHDLLGHRLSAVSLKGDLALALLPTEPDAANAEIDSLVAVARDALRDTGAVTHARHAVSLATELEGADALLKAADIATTIDLDLPELRSPLDEALAWATRECVTNILRHSKADTCLILGRRDAGCVTFEIVNDGIDHAPAKLGRCDQPDGQGLSGVAERVHAVGGRLSTTISNGRFHLAVEMPDANVEPNRSKLA